jgi:hypothetical protein
MCAIKCIEKDLRGVCIQVYFHGLVQRSQQI